MSHSPVRTEEPDDDYVLGWKAINRLIRRGYSWSGNERNNAFLNLRDGTFVDVSAASGFDFPDDARALAVADWDLDGAPDLFVTNRNGPRLRFLRNRAGVGGRSLSLRLVQPDGDLDAIGARVELELEDGSVQRLVRSVQAGSGYLAQSSAWLHFGLGTSGRSKRALVRWPLGEEEAFTGLDGPGSFLLERGKGRAERWTPGDSRAPLAEPTPGEEAGLALLRDPHGRRIVLASSVPMPRLSVVSSDGSSLELFGIRPGGGGTGTGRAILLELWSRTCVPCLAELSEFARARAELEQAGIAFLALSVDEDASAAREVLAQIGWPFAWASAPRETIELLDALHGAILDRDLPLPLPASFLIDAQGNWRALWLGRVDPERLAEDRELLDLLPEEMRERATPFPGRWAYPAQGADLGFFEAKLRARGFTAAADEFARARIEIVESSPAKVLHGFGRAALERGKIAEAIENFRKATEADPRHFQAFFDLGFLYQQQGELLEAISAYRAALRIDPAHEEARFNLALAFLVREDFEAAERERAALEERGSALAPELAQALEIARAGQRPKER